MVPNDADTRMQEDMGAVTFNNSDSANKNPDGNTADILRPANAANTVSAVTFPATALMIKLLKAMIMRVQHKYNNRTADRNFETNIIKNLDVAKDAQYIDVMIAPSVFVTKLYSLTRNVIRKEANVSSTQQYIT